MKIVQDENQHNDFEKKFYRRSLLKRKIRYSKFNIDLFRTSNAFRFKNKKR
jgi:hypothetical protein